MGYIESNLLPNERVIHRARLHAIVVLGPVFALIFLLLMALALAALMPPLAVVVGVLALIAALGVVVAVLRRSSTELAVTNRRVIAKAGVLSRKTLEMNITKIENLSIEQGLMARMVGYGTVVVIGTGGTRERIEKVAEPGKFKNAVQAQAAEAESVAPVRTAAKTSAEPELTEDRSTRITVKAADGATKSYTLKSSEPVAVQKAIAKLTAQGCSVVNIEVIA